LGAKHTVGAAPKSPWLSACCEITRYIRNKCRQRLVCVSIVFTTRFRYCAYPRRVGQAEFTMYCVLQYGPKDNDVEVYNSADFSGWRLLGALPVRYVASSGVQMSTWSGANVQYLRDELRRPADTQARRRLRSASSTSLDVRRRAYSSVQCRWQSVPCYSRSSVEQSSIACHCCCPSLHLLLSS